jgi:hypothetical protein
VVIYHAMSALGQKPTLCAATSHVRFTPNSDRESEIPQKAMSALPPKADMCGATRDVRFGPIADIDGLRGPLAGRFGPRQELCRIPGIARFMPFSSLVGLPMFTVRFREIFGCPC